MSEPNKKFLDYDGLKKYDGNIKNEIKNLISVNPNDEMIIFNTDGSYSGVSTYSTNELNELYAQIEAMDQSITEMRNDITRLEGIVTNIQSQLNVK